MTLIWKLICKFKDHDWIGFADATAPRGPGLPNFSNMEIHRIGRMCMRCGRKEA